MASFPPSLRSGQVLFSRPVHGQTTVALAGWFLLFCHVRNGCDDGFEQELELPLLTEALHPFEPGDDQTFTGVFEGIERAALHTHALGHVSL